MNDMMVQDSDSDIEIFDLLDPSVSGKVVGKISISCSVEVYGIPCKFYRCWEGFLTFISEN